MTHIAILGGGISGLATAWFLKQALGSSLHLTILEKEPRGGGWIQTLQTQGFLFEQGPRSCRSKGAGQETLALVEALGLENQLLTPHPDARNRYIYHEQRLQRLPKHLWEIPFNSLTKGWLRALWRDWRMPKRQENDESIHSFFTRRLALSWAENLVDPFISGIYAGDCRRLSLQSCFPLLDQWEQQQGSLLRGGWNHRPSPAEPSVFVQKMRRFPLFSFREGMETLPRALMRELKEHCLLGKAVNRLIFNQQNIEMQLDSGERLIADSVISTLPAYTLGALLPHHPSLAAQLNTLPYASIAVVNVGFHQNVLPFKGFGYLIPSKFSSQVLGCVWDSSVFPQQNAPHQTRLTCMMGGSRYPEVEQMSENELIELTLRMLREHLGIRMQPQVVQVKQAKRAIPQFEVGYALWKTAIQKEFYQLSPYLTLSGSTWNGVSINDCIVQARQISRHFAENFAGNPLKK